MSFKAVLFDLDGTLVDNFAAVHHCCNLVQKDMGLPLTDYATVKATVGGSIVLTMQRLVGPELAPEAVRRYSAYFSEGWSYGLEVLPGAAWLLKELEKAGILRAVLTNKNETHAWAIMNHLGLGGLLNDIIGTTDADAAQGIRKPNPAFTQRALDRIGCSAADTLMVGDSPFDAHTGGNMGMHVRLVSTGTHSAEALAALPVDGIHASLCDLGEKAFGFDCGGVC